LEETEVKHKWHKEIKAWTDGAEIEYRTKLYGTWGNWMDDDNPTWNDKYEYRIKPSVKEPQYLYAYVKLGRTQVEFHRGYKAGNIPDLHGIEYLGKIKLEEE
jgi:hypothetical protein